MFLPEQLLPEFQGPAQEHLGPVFLPGPGIGLTQPDHVLDGFGIILTEKFLANLIVALLGSRGQCPVFDRVFLRELLALAA